MRDLLIYGAGSPNVVKLVAAINRQRPTWNILGFLDDTPGREGESFMGVDILGGRDRLDSLANRKTSFINNVASTTSARGKVTALLAAHGCELALLVHPAVDQEFTVIGRDVMIAHGARLEANVRIGDHCIIRSNATIGHDGVLGENVFVGPGATLCGHVKAGENAYVGAGSTIIQRISIGSGSVVGAGAVVSKDVPPGTTVAGPRARNLRR